MPKDYFEIPLSLWIGAPHGNVEDRKGDRREMPNQFELTGHIVAAFLSRDSDRLAQVITGVTNIAKRREQSRDGDLPGQAATRLEALELVIDGVALQLANAQKPPADRSAWEEASYPKEFLAVGARTLADCTLIYERSLAKVAVVPPYPSLARFAQWYAVAAQSAPDMASRLRLESATIASKKLNGKLAQSYEAALKKAELMGRAPSDALGWIGPEIKEALANVFALRPELVALDKKHEVRRDSWLSPPSRGLR